MKKYLPLGAWLMNALILTAGEHGASKSTAIGKLLDFLNGRLAGAKPEAVLVARVKKQLKGLKG
jgi:hypothetical protein